MRDLNSMSSPSRDPNPSPNPNLNSVRIVEVSPRDGLQNIPQRIPTSTKLELIHRLSQTGLTTIEITSIVSPRAVPQLADAREILSHESIRGCLFRDQRLECAESGDSSDSDSGFGSGFKTGSDRSRSSSSSSLSLTQQYELSTTPAARKKELHLPVLIPNMKGLSIALSHGVTDIALFISATEGFSQTNTNCTVEQGLTRARDVTRNAKQMGIMRVRGYISCIFTDPITQTTTPLESVLHCTRSLLDAGVDEVALSDTTGTGTPILVSSLLHHLSSHPNNIPLSRLAAHFHDSHGRGLQNVWAAYEAGIRVFDASVAGLGGCPFAPGAKGNVDTGELVGFFEGRGVRTGVDRERLGSVAGWVRGVVDRYRDGDGNGGGDGSKAGELETGGRYNGSGVRDTVKRARDTTCPIGHGR
ncbi:hydroxymethylglutaryl-CoA lyase [Aspergillus undulatus]|uniref:hydroxymethylglutaryl-CoA lyase n=1 Tax=Aspergillus undulatus TaxID=1810928 RepID=UPI003CCCFEFD